MEGFAFVTAVVLDTPYYEDIYPITGPLFQSYCDKWGIDCYTKVITPGELEPFTHNTAPYGTGADYCSIPFRRRLLDDYKGVVFMDVDAVIVDDTYDICREVNDNMPMAAVGDFNGGVVVMRSHPMTKMFLNEVWDRREQYRGYQWLEQAAMMELVGYEVGVREAPPVFVRETKYSPLWGQLSPRWNWGPNSPPLPPCTDKRYEVPLVFHPMGVQPYADRLRLIKQAAFAAKGDMRNG